MIQEAAFQLCCTAPRPSRVRLVCFLLALLIQGSLPAQSSTRETPEEQARRLCSLPTPGEHWVVIDANSGSASRTRLPANAGNVTLLFRNKNPFKYAYTVDVTAKPLDEGLAQGFVSGILGISLAPLGPLVALDLSALRGLPNCSPKAKELIAKLEQILTSNSHLTSLPQSVRDTVDLAKSFTSSTDTENLASCETSWKEALQLEDNLPDVLDRINEVRKFEEQMAEFLKEVETEIAGAPTDTCLEAILNKAKSEQATVTSENKLLVDNKDAFEDLLRIINRATTLDGPFWHTMPAPRTGAGADLISVVIVRKNIRDPNAADQEKEVSMSIQIGESLFSISAGVGFSFVDEVKIIRQSSLIPDGEGGTELGTAFGFESNSNFSPGGVFLLNANVLPNTPHVGLALSLGAVIRDGGDDTEVEFLAGPSLTFADGLILLTPAFHAARVPSLSGGFKIGDPVPDGLQDPLPLEKSFKGALIITLTVKLR